MLGWRQALLHACTPRSHPVWLHACTSGSPTIAAKSAHPPPGEERRARPQGCACRGQRARCPMDQQPGRGRLKGTAAAAPAAHQGPRQQRLDEMPGPLACRRQWDGARAWWAGAGCRTQCCTPAACALPHMQASLVSNSSNSAWASFSKRATSPTLHPGRCCHAPRPLTSARRGVATASALTSPPGRPSQAEPRHRCRCQAPAGAQAAAAAPAALGRAGARCDRC